jgi:hypothetical protein
MIRTLINLNGSEVIDFPEFKVTKSKKVYKKRPPEWQEIAIKHQNFK